MTEIGIGDPVEARFIHREDGELWVPATVTNIRRGSVGVAFADGQRMQVRNGEWRRAHKVADAGAK